MNYLVLIFLITNAFGQDAKTRRWCSRVENRNTVLCRKLQTTTPVPVAAPTSNPNEADLLREQLAAQQRELDRLTAIVERRQANESTTSSPAPPLEPDRTHHTPIRDVMRETVTERNGRPFVCEPTNPDGPMGSPDPHLVTIINSTPFAIALEFNGRPITVSGSLNPQAGSEYKGDDFSDDVTLLYPRQACFFRLPVGQGVLKYNSTMLYSIYATYLSSPPSHQLRLPDLTVDDMEKYAVARRKKDVYVGTRLNQTVTFTTGIR